MIRRNAALLAAYSFILGLIALLGYMAIAAGVDKDPAYAAGLRRIRARTSPCRRCSSPRSRPGSSASPSRRSPSARWCRPPSCRSPVPISSPAISTRNSCSPNCTRRRGSAHGEDRVAGREDRRGGVHPRHSASLRHPAPACSAASGSSSCCRRSCSVSTRGAFNAQALLVGWVAGLAVGHLHGGGARLHLLGLSAYRRSA